MIKLALALSLMLGACSADRALDAKVVHTFPRDGVMFVWVPDHEDLYTVNAEDFAAGMVPASALTCPSLADMGRADPSQRFYFDPSDTGDDNDGPTGWTLKGCEHLNEFADHNAHPDTWEMPPVDTSDALQWAREGARELCAETCDNYGDCDACDSYTGIAEGE